MNSVRDNIENYKLKYSMDIGYQKTLFFIVNVIIFTMLLHSLALSQQRSFNAEFVKILSLPGSNNHIVRPAYISYDRIFNEILIADQGNNRLVIFDSLGNYNFEFTTRRSVNSVLDIAVDKEGFIFILGTTKSGNKIFKYDFDGLFLGTVEFENSDEFGKIINFELDSNNNYYLLNEEQATIFVNNSEGRFVNSFSIIKDTTEVDLDEIVMGSMTLYNDQLYIPISNLSSVYIFDLNGTHIKSIGHRGSLAGEFTFPVDVTVSKDGMIMVLDKMRFCVICFDKEYNFIGEFGGKGSRPGWFYHPSILETDFEGNVIIGQIFKNYIQKCKIPKFIHDSFYKDQENQKAINYDLLGMTNATN